jgi:hypothetical protein
VSIGYVTLAKTSSAFNLAGQGTITSKTEVASGSFAKYTIDAVGTAPFSLTQIGACYVYRRSGTSQQISQGIAATPLNAGTQLTLNGPNATNVAMPMLAGGGAVYAATLYSSGFMGVGGSGSPTLVQGTYTISGTGGSDVGPFSATLTFPGDFTWTNQDTIADPIPRTAPLTVNWTGGTTGVVSITGSAYASAGGTIESPVYNASLFSCIAPATAGTFTVPVSVLSQLFSVSNDPTSGSFGSLSVFDVIGPDQGKFTAPLTAGGSVDQAFFGFSVGGTKTTGWQ